MKPTPGEAALPSTSTSVADAGGQRLRADGDAVAHLPLHLTEKILSHITPLESVRLATVCKSWATIVERRLPRPVPPHLFAFEIGPSGAEPRRGAIISVPLDGGGDVSARGGSAFPARLAPSAAASGMRCVGGTWDYCRLAFVHDKTADRTVRVHLVNPLTGASRTMSASTASSAPVCLSRGGDSSFFFQEGDRSVTALWDGEGKRDDSVWHLMPDLFFGQEVLGAAQSEGVFYVLHRDGRLYTADFRDPPRVRMTELPVSRRRRDHLLGPHCRDCDCEKRTRGHLIGSDGDLFFVWESVENPGPGTCWYCGSAIKSAGGFEVYKFDQDNLHLQWVKLESLGSDQALFISEWSSFSVRASEMAGCMSNCIYFVKDNDMWGVYSMAEGRMLFEHTVGTSRRYTNACWFLPNGYFFLRSTHRPG